MDENDRQRKKLDRYWNWACSLAMLGLSAWMYLDAGRIDPNFVIGAIALLSFLDIMRNIVWWINRRDHSRTAKRHPDPP